MSRTSSRSLLALGALALGAVTLTSHGARAQGAPPYIPGLPVPVIFPTIPAAPPPPGTPPGGTATPPGTPPGGNIGGGIRALPPGAVDRSGAMTPAFLESEATAILNEMVAALPAREQAKVRGIPLAIDRSTKEINAFAGCRRGVAFMAITGPLLKAMGHMSEAKAADERFGSQRVDQYTKMAAAAIRAGRAVPSPPANFYTPAQAHDPAKLSRQRVVANEMIGFVLGHELAHHYLGHTGCANGAGAGGFDPTRIGRIAGNIVPVFGQSQEAASDVSGTKNVLNTGAARQRRGGQALTETGGVLTLNFFGALGELSPSSVLLGVLRTHPHPRLRIPLVQSTAQNWRRNKGGGSSGGASPFPFPFPFPGFGG